MLLVHAVMLLLRTFNPTVPPTAHEKVLNMPFLRRLEAFRVLPQLTSVLHHYQHSGWIIFWVLAREDQKVKQQLCIDTIQQLILV